MRLPPHRRYWAGARVYDVISGERPVYRPGRVLGIERAGLEPGHRVLDLACGTGLNLPLVQDRIGSDGTVVGIDASAAMLDVARTRCRRAGWSNVELRCCDAARLDALADLDRPFDAVLVTYALSIIQGWHEAFEQSLSLLRTGGRIVVVDMSYPTGRWRAFAPLAALAFAVGGVDPHRAPWRLVLEQTDDALHETLKGGHVHVVSGTKR
ncbi:MAG: class I SAM-dependent methyltransferase [Jatrophihabitans sp.]